MGKIKLFNDPIHGLISYPHEIIYDLIEHEYFQRLRRISQMGLSSLVYPGATHNRFQHALGATYLMVKALQTLEEKGVEMTTAEREAACIAILCHDLGHGPFSHTLEGKLLKCDHETLTVTLMKSLEKTFGAPMALAIDIFQGTYPKSFLHELVSSQLDVDRLDYLSRDSFYTGVSEGVVGTERILKMIDVVNNELVVEEKGKLSIENYLIARYMMYWQVYLHKTSFVAEKMLELIIERIILKMSNKNEVLLNKNISFIFENSMNYTNTNVLNSFVKLDDSDIYSLIKDNLSSDDEILHFLCNSLIKRNLFYITLHNDRSQEKECYTKIQKIQDALKINEDDAKKLVLSGVISTKMYDASNKTIKLKLKSDEIIPFSSELIVEKNAQDKFFIAMPRI